MKKLVMVVMILLCASVGWAGPTIYERSMTIISLQADTPNSSLVEIDMNGEAGFLLSIACDTDSSDDFDVWIFDHDLDGSGVAGEWYGDADRDKDTILIYSKASSTTSFRDDTTIPSWSIDEATSNTTMYIGVYNDDPSATINCKFRYTINANDDFGLVTQDMTP